MYFRRRPDHATVRHILRGLRRAPFRYGDVGATRQHLRSAPPGFTLDQYGCDLGAGDAVWERAREALRRLDNYPPSFTDVVWECEGDSCREGAQFATVAAHFGFYSAHPCRVIYVEDSPSYFTVGFGTLPGHAELGEESFSLEVQQSGNVRYRVQAFSRPLGVAKLGKPIARHLQLRFQRETLRRMRTIVGA